MFEVLQIKKFWSFFLKDDNKSVNIGETLLSETQKENEQDLLKIKYYRQ